jgi:hypothetical protein
VRLGASASEVVHTNVLCRIGLHSWTFKTTTVEAHGGRIRVEAVYARCRRTDCPTFSEARLVHWEGETSVGRTAIGRQLFLPRDVF